MEVTSAAINVNDLVIDRVNDIRQIFQALKSGRTTRTPMQRLPRHMRRRAMSHNIKRMPRRWRNFALAATKKAKHAAKAPSRFQRRRRRFAGGDDPTLLRTHVWHAKRYHMALTYGVKLPRKCFQKVQRNCIRKTAQGASIVDNTYFAVYTVETTPESEPSITNLLNTAAGKVLKFNQSRAQHVDLHSESLSLGPVVIRKPTPTSFEFVVHPTAANAFEALFTDVAKPQRSRAHGRARLYGPKALSTIVSAFNLTKTADENMFNDVLDGAVIVGSVWFSLNLNLPGQKPVPVTLTILSTRPHTQIDLSVPSEHFKAVWIRLVHSQCRVLGLDDEWNIRTYLGKFTYPDDAPEAVASKDVLKEETTALETKHYRRPTNRRVNYAALSPENPFDFNWEKLESEGGSELVPVKIVPLTRGVPKRFTFLYSEVDSSAPESMEVDDPPAAPSPPKVKKTFDTDENGVIEISEAPGFPKLVSMDRLFEMEPRKVLSRGMKKRRKRKAAAESPVVPEPVKLQIPQGTVIGRIIRGLRWSSPQGNHLGLGYCLRTEVDKILAEKDGIVLFRNPESRHYRQAKLIVCDRSARF
uniref:Ribonucleases P/MRP protein subunit POP1 n=1 Tax=Panagrellus redivivus TaxID=6233 RepID=A0A7E4VXJ8_PANRE